MKNIIFTILILIFILVVIRGCKEKFTNSGKKVDSQKLNILQSFIKSNTNDFCSKTNDEGLFVDRN